jgi:hypothetical protein
MVTHPFPEKPEISNEDTATEVVEAPSFKIQHCSPASSLHRHSSEYDNQQSPPNPIEQAEVSNEATATEVEEASSLHLHSSQSDDQQSLPNPFLQPHGA